MRGGGVAEHLALGRIQDGFLHRRRGGEVAFRDEQRQYVLIELRPLARAAGLQGLKAGKLHGPHGSEKFLLVTPSQGVAHGATVDS